MAPIERAMIERVLATAGTMPPEIREILENYVTPRSGVGGMIVLRVLGIFFFLTVGAIFSTLGGLLGTAIFKKSLPPGTLDIPPA
jgi:hypothetical protein